MPLDIQPLMRLDGFCEIANPKDFRMQVTLVTRYRKCTDGKQIPEGNEYQTLCWNG
jgi:hypothetical protein